MSTIEKQKTLQKEKPYDGRKQDHGDAAEQKGHFHFDNGWGEDSYERRHLKSLDKALFSAAMADTFDGFEQLTPEELEVAADKLLGGSELVAATTEGDDGEYDYIDEPEDEAEADWPTYGFASENELGLKSKKNIRDSLAREATLDSDADDDYGDSDFGNPVRIRNNLR